ncbi:hypothetical protein ACI78R_03095 [Geodermatophilus sp. SYSU D01106]
MPSPTCAEPCHEVPTGSLRPRGRAPVPAGRLTWAPRPRAVPDRAGPLHAVAVAGAVVADRHGQDALVRLHRAWGEAVHTRGAWPDVGDLLERAGLPPHLAEVMTGDAHDDLVRASHTEGIGLVGTHVGTPVLAVREPGRPRVAVFGPVLSRVPRGEEAGRLWDGVVLVGGTVGFHELKGRPPGPPRT